MMYRIIEHSADGTLTRRSDVFGSFRTAVRYAQYGAVVKDNNGFTGESIAVTDLQGNILYRIVIG